MKNENRMKNKRKWVTYSNNIDSEKAVGGGSVALILLEIDKK